MPRSFESLFMHFDLFLSVLEQKNLIFTTMDLLSYPFYFCFALLFLNGAPLVTFRFIKFWLTDYLAKFSLLPYPQQRILSLSHLCYLVSLESETLLNLTNQPAPQLKCFYQDAEWTVRVFISEQIWLVKTECIKK